MVPAHIANIMSLRRIKKLCIYLEHLVNSSGGVGLWQWKLQDLANRCSGILLSRIGILWHDRHT